MQRRIYSLVIILAVLAGCNSDNGTTEPVVECLADGIPSYDYSIYPGATSVDISFEVDRPGTLHYIVSSDEVPTDNARDFAGSVHITNQFQQGGNIKLSCDQYSASNTVTVSNLDQDETYNLYFLVSGDTIETEFPVVKESFGTQPNISVRSYPSSEVNRDALYYIYQPDSLKKNPDTDVTYPLVIFLGGNGEVAPAGELNINRNSSMVRYLDRGFQIPFIVVAPEHTANNWDLSFLKEFVDYAKEKYNVDEDFIIMTGMSGGGIGTWNYAVTYPEDLDVIVPISGHGPANMACKLVNMSIYAFHNDIDEVVDVEGTIEMINAVNSCGPNKPVEMQLFQDDGHNAWVRVYDPNNGQWELDPTATRINIYDWILSQR